MQKNWPSINREFLRLSPATKLFDDALRLLKRIEESEQSVMFYTASMNAPQLFEAALNCSNVLRKARVPITRQEPDQTRDELVQQLIGGHDPQDFNLIDDSPMRLIWHVAWDFMVGKSAVIILSQWLPILGLQFCHRLISLYW